MLRTRSPGEELFRKEWVPGEKTRHGGDGVGPVYNATSCAKCHHLGGVGGAGRAKFNVDIIAFFQLKRGEQPNNPKVKAVETPEQQRDRQEATRVLQRGRLAQLHETIGNESNAILHQFGPRGYTAWRNKLTGARQAALGSLFLPGMESDAEGMTTIDTVSITAQEIDRQLDEPTPDPAQAKRLGRSFRTLSSSRTFEDIMAVRWQRNTPALFGSGIIDLIPDQALHDAAATKHAGFPEVTGRVSRLTDGSIGRFGWKAQTASVHDFVLSACAVELGLHVPGRAQTAPPTEPNYQPPGYDLDEDECRELAEFVRQLPPLERSSVDKQAARTIKEGKEHFAKVGCAACHVPALASAEGVYSDLLLHDMGPSSASSGGYYGSPSDNIPAFATASSGMLPEIDPSPRLSPRRDAVVPLSKKQAATMTGALPTEWRTPPLWGIAESAPYLHDGRAVTLSEAIDLHSGEAAESVKRYRKLTQGEQASLIAFLRSL